MALKGKVALVTGSTSGIGLGIARALAAEGASIMLNGFGDAGEIEALRADLEKEFSVKVAYDGADLSKPDQVAAIVQKTQDELGSIDILVNNAGIQFTAPVEEFPEAKWEAIISINLSAVFYGMKAAIPAMKKNGWGRIINIASAHGLVASPHKVAYVAAKHGVVGATKVAAIETAVLRRGKREKPASVSHNMLFMRELSYSWPVGRAGPVAWPWPGRSDPHGDRNVT